MSLTPSPTKFARSGDLHIAYQVVGTGPFDLVYVPGWVSHVELAWDEPEHASFLRQLASFCRLISFDKRGTGLSDRVPNDKLPTLEERMDDLRAVMDAVGSKRAALFGISEGGNLCTLFSATYPQRTVALIVFGTFAKRIWSADYPWAPTPEEREKEYELVEREWGGLMDLARYVPSKIADEAFTRRFATYLRRSASPGAAVALLRMNTQIDIRHVLPAVRVPSLVMHRVGDRDVNIAEGRWIADRIPGARFVELVGDDHEPWLGDQQQVVDEIQEFLTGARSVEETNRVLVTILFTDLVGSTERAASLGDYAWQALLEQHHALVRAELDRFRGRLVRSTGDGILATFDGPARAIQCARRLRECVERLGLALRIGLHAGEVTLTSDGIEGISVHIAARIAAHATKNQTLVSSTVKDLVAGSRIEFTDCGLFDLKGVFGQWRLFAAH